MVSSVASGSETCGSITAAAFRPIKNNVPFRSATSTGSKSTSSGVTWTDDSSSLYSIAIRLPADRLERNTTACT